MNFLVRFKSSFFVPNRRFLVVSFSSFSKSFNSEIRETALRNPAETSVITSLFNEITEILGADIVTPDETRIGFPVFGETHVKHAVSGEDSDSCTQNVRGNAEVGVSGEKENTQMGSQVEFDFDLVVHEITRVIRADDDVVPMEDRLENLGFQFEPEIVEKVLKRCFKVPHLALRFFNWVKNRDDFSHTTETYNMMLYIAGEAAELGMVDELLKDMEGNSCKKDIRTWTILISVYGEAKKIGQALLVFEKMRKNGYEPDAAAYKMMIRSLCIAGKGDVALEFYREMIGKDMAFDLKMYKTFLNCIARSEKFDVVQSVADDMVRICEIPEHDAYGCLLKSFCVSGKVREALELIRDLKSKGMGLSSEYLEILVKGLCRANRITDALEIVDIMKRRNLVDSNVYGIVINGYLRKNDTSKALELFEVMKNSGHSPRASTYTEIMQHFFKSKEYQKGYNLFNEMIENGTELDAVAITAMVAGHVRQNHIAEAWKLFNSMEEKGIKPTWKSYSIFVKELCRASRYDEILNLLNQMQASKVSVGDDVFSWVISCMERKGEKEKIEKVKQMQRKYKSYSKEQNAFTQGAFGEKEELIVESNHPHPAQNQQASPAASAVVNEMDVQEICHILSSSLDWNTIQEALEKSTIEFTPELVTEILHNSKMQGNAVLHFFSWVGKRHGFQHTTDTYNMAIKVAGCGKDFKHMRSLFYEMKRRGCFIKPDTWAIMIMQYGRAGLTDIAVRTFEEMKDRGFIPSGSTFKCLITVLCGKKGRNVEEAIRRFQEMIRLGFVPDRGLVEDYLRCLCEVGNLKKAKTSLDSLGKIGFSIPLAYSMYIRALCRVGKLEEALSLLDGFENKTSLLDQYTYGSIVHGLLRQGRLEEAIAKADAMKQMGINPSVHVYTSLIVHFFKEKQLEKVLEICQAMEKECCKPSVVTYTAMICGYMNLGKTEDAWNIFHNMKEKGPSPDFKTYTKFINCLCQVGKSEDALNLLTEMLDKGIVPSTVNFRTVFYGLNREGKQDLARKVVQKKSALVAQRKMSV